MSRRPRRASAEHQAKQPCCVSGKQKNYYKSKKGKKKEKFRVAGAHFGVRFRPLRSEQAARAAHPRKAHVQEIPKSPV